MTEYSLFRDGPRKKWSAIHFSCKWCIKLSANFCGEIYVATFSYFFRFLWLATPKLPKIVITLENYKIVENCTTIAIHTYISSIKLYFISWLFILFLLITYYLVYSSHALLNFIAGECNQYVFYFMTILINYILSCLLLSHTSIEYRSLWV